MLALPFDIHGNLPALEAVPDDARAAVWSDSGPSWHATGGC
jgi:hypothetical protein